MARVEFFSADGDHLAYMTFESIVPEEGEDPFIWPVFTDFDPNDHDLDWWEDLVGGLEVLDENGDALVWEDPEYLKYMVKEFRPGALTAILTD